MESLKKYSERLAPLMGLSPAALYERQRRLVRLKLLKMPATIGPGGGVRATPANVATLLLACLATDNLSEVSAQVGKIARTSANQGRCLLTQAINLGDALKRILSEPGLAETVTSVTFYRSEGKATVGFLKNGLIQQSHFGRVSEEPLFTVWAILGGPLLKTIADDLSQEEA